MYMQEKDVRLEQPCFFTIKDKAVPNVVGVDIGCGMYTVNLGKGELDLKK